MRRMNMIDEFLRSSVTESLPLIDVSSRMQMVRDWLRSREGKAIILERNNPTSVKNITDVDVIEDCRRTDSAMNEDRGIFRETDDAMLLCVFDGATTISDVSSFQHLGISPGALAAEVSREAARFAPLTITPRDIILRSHAALQAILQFLNISPEEQEACSTTAFIGILEMQRLRWAGIGDSFGFRVRGDDFLFLNDDNPELRFEVEYIRAAERDAKKYGLPVHQILTLPNTEFSVVNNRHMHHEENRPDGKGYGVIRGGGDAPAMSQYILEGGEQLISGDVLALCTDGVLPSPCLSLANRRRVIRENWLRRRSIRSLFDAIREQETDDAACTAWPRIKQHDDVVAMQIFTNYLCEE